MYIERIYTACLAEAAYYIESEGEAAVIDPMREVEPFLELASERGALIKYVLETHFHADFVSGHLDLARQTGAQIIYGPAAKAAYTITVAEDGQLFPLGNGHIKVLHTPGHTLESSCYLWLNANNKPEACFTGDTLFVGEVGRPDLAVSNMLSKEQLAEMLYESLHGKLLTLPDDVVVYPGHGAGSACGKNIGSEAYTTIGEQRKYNYALQPVERSEFITLVAGSLPEPPKYFFMDAGINKKGYEPLAQVISHNAVPMNADAFVLAQKQGALVLDTRDAETFGQGFVPGAVNIGLDGQYANWVGTLLDAGQPLILVTEPGFENEAVIRLARIGYEHVKGYLEGGIATWRDKGWPLDIIESIPAEAFVHIYKPETLVLDVRNTNELEAGQWPHATHMPLPHLAEYSAGLDKRKQYFIHCAGGYRSMIAASMLRAQGFLHVTNISGGYNAIQKYLPQEVEG